MKFAALGNILFLIAVFTIITLLPYGESVEEDYVTFKISRHSLPETTDSESASPYGKKKDVIDQKSESEDLIQEVEAEKASELSNTTGTEEVKKAEKSVMKMDDDVPVDDINGEEKQISEKALSEFTKLDKQSGLSDVAYFSQFVKIYKEAWVKGVNPDIRKDVVIRYYVKEEDGDAVFSLRQFGYYIHERPTSERFNMLPSNALYFGSQVNVVDIKMVAYSLMAKGITLKVIEPSQFSDDWKANSIEIGSDDTILEKPSMSLAQLRKLKIK